MMNNWNRGINGVRFPDCCKDCRPPKRSINCHANCKDYLDAKAEHEVEANAERETRKAAADADNAVYILRRN